MENIFNPDNKFFTFMGRVADLIILNALFMICSIPIITIGPSLTAMYYVTLKMVRDEESYITKGFFKSFKENFKQGTIIWLILLAFIFLLTADFLIFQELPELTGFLKFVRYGLYVLALLVAMVTLYVFPVLAKFANTIKQTIKNALLFSILHLLKTILMLAICVAPLLLMLYGTGQMFTYGILAFLICGFSLIAFINSFFFVRIFDKYIPKEEAEETIEETEDETQVM